MAAAPKIPSGMGMLMKSFGIDPSVIPQVAGAVKAIAEALDKIQKQNDEILALLKGRNSV